MSMRRLVFMGVVTLACAGDGPGPPVQAVLVVGGLSGRVAEPVDVAVRLLDAHDQVIPGTRLTAAPSAGALEHAEAVTDEVGVAVFEWTLGTLAGPQALDVTVGDDGVTSRLFVEAMPGPAATARFTQAVAFATGDSLFRFPVTAEDIWGNPVPDPPIRSVDFTIGADSARWIPRTVGRVRFVTLVPASDTMDVYVHPPRGAYYARFRSADTTWIETGTLVAGATGASAFCPPSGGVVGFRVYDAENVRRLRFAAGFSDTVHADVRPGAVVHVVDPAVDPQLNQSVRYRPLGVDTASTCHGTQFVRVWRFAIWPNFADSLAITPP